MGLLDNFCNSRVDRHDGFSKRSKSSTRLLQEHMRTAKPPVVFAHHCAGQRPMDFQSRRMGPVSIDIIILQAEEERGMHYELIYHI